MGVSHRHAAARRALRNRAWKKPSLYFSQILAWADAHFERTGDWPRADSGRIHEAKEETWRNVSQALRLGLRRLPGGSSLARLLAERRGRRNRKALPRYSPRQILDWADRHHRRTGRWPRGSDGPVVDAPGETWVAVNVALRQGRRGLPGGSSLAQLLAEQRGKPNRMRMPRLRVTQILAWADAHHRRSGLWPTESSGAILGVAGETWNGVSKSLRYGRRGLRGGSSLSRLLKRRRRRGRATYKRTLSEKMVLAWADAYFARRGRWPTDNSGPIQEAPEETWNGVSEALRTGVRGFRGGLSLARLLERRRRAANGGRTRLSVRQILSWAEAHYARTGRWPTKGSGPVREAPGENWDALNQALSHGRRGLSRRGSLSQLLSRRRRRKTRSA